MLKYFFLLFIFYFPANGHALNLDGFKLPKNYQAKFVQVRHIKSIDTKLKSSGNIEIINGQKLIWKQNFPFEHITIIGADSISAGTKEKMNKMDSPFAKHISSIILNILSGKKAKLKTQFNISGKIGALELIPRDNSIAKIIKSIKIIGVKKINKVILLFSFKLW